MKPTIYSLIISIFLLFNCNQKNPKNGIEAPKAAQKGFPYLTYNKSQLFPGDGSLKRAEDGVALEDGTIVVVDQTNGLRIIEKDGSSRPFGDFKSVGFVHNPPENIAGPNGLVLDHDGKHLLMCDVADGKIYRTNVETEKVELIYDHEYGVNSLYCDKTGTIWFTQCAKNINYQQMFLEINSPGPNGAVFRMNGLNSTPELIKDSLYFANGVTMDNTENSLFISETAMGRVHAFKVDQNSRKTKYSGVVATVGTPDNIVFDNQGNLIVASPVNNQVVAVDFKNHSQHIIFDASTKENKKVTDEWFRRTHLGLEFGDLFTPKLYNPLPGLLTGMFFSKDGETLYIANLGGDLIKLDYK